MDNQSLSGIAEMSFEQIVGFVDDLSLLDGSLLFGRELTGEVVVAAIKRLTIIGSSEEEFPEKQREQARELAKTLADVLEGISSHAKHTAAPNMMHQQHPEVKDIIFGTKSIRDVAFDFVAKKLNRSQQTNLLAVYNIFGLSSFKKELTQARLLGLEKALLSLSIIGTCWATFYWVDSRFHLIIYVTLLALFFAYSLGVLQCRLMTYCARLNAMTSLALTENIQSAIRMGSNEYASYLKEESVFKLDDENLSKEEVQQRAIALHFLTKE